MGIGLLLEGFDAAEHPRGRMGRWIATFHHPVHGRTTSPVDARSSSEAMSKARALDVGTVQSVTPFDGAARKLVGVEADTKAAARSDRVKVGEVYQVQRPDGQGGRWRVSSAGPVQVELTSERSGRKQITEHRDVLNPTNFKRVESASTPTSASADRHGGFKIGDVVTHETGSRAAGGHGPVTFTKQPGLSTVVGLQRNGNLRIKHPETGTTHDVHHSHAQKVGPLHPDYRGKVVQDAYAAQRSVIAAEKASRARQMPPARPFSKVVRDRLPQGDNAATVAQQRRLGRVLDDIQTNTRDHSEAQRVLRWHLARANVRSVPDLSSRELSLLLNDLQGLAKHGPSALESEPASGALGALLEGFVAAAAGPPASWGGRFDVRDNVSVPVRGGEVTGRVLRASGARPDTHVIIDPGGGAAHVEAEVGKVRLHTPESYAAGERRAQAVAARSQAAGGAPGAGGGGRSGAQGSSGAVREGVGLLLEGFVPPETPAQSQSRGARQVATAQKQLSAGWNASKHPRARGGKFGYTTGGKRATRSSAASSRTLGVGAKGALVKAIQRQLHVAADGVYGRQTRAAVTRFQQQHGIQVDGVVGAQTVAALRGAPNARSVKPGPITSRVARVHPAQRSTRASSRVPTKTQRAAAGKRQRFGGGVIV